MLGEGLIRTDDHEYYWNAQGPFPGVTTVQKVLDLGKTDRIKFWAAKMIAEKAVNDAFRLAWSLQAPEADREAITKSLATLPDRTRDAAADLGSSVHWHAEQIANGRYPDVPAAEWPFIRQYLAWRDDFDPEYIAIEYQGINLAHRYGGTGDLIVRPRRGPFAGERLLLDIKSGRSYDETAFQLVACAEFEFTGVADDPEPRPMPEVDRFGVLDLKPDGWQVIPYRFNRERVFEAFTHLCALYHARRDWKGVRRMGDAITGRATEEFSHDAA